MLKIDWRKRIEWMPYDKISGGYAQWRELNEVEKEYLTELILEIIKQCQNQ